jgi:S-adenosylmethionine:tRNA ribosyltransferase-isomerase
LFLRQMENGLWELLSQTRGTLRPGETIDVDPGPLQLHLETKTPEGHWLARPDPAGPPQELLAAHGHVPLPFYIRKGREQASDRERYQTVYAGQPGAVAAPTAGLHFTRQLFDRLATRNIGRADLTLHVGLGTFQPIQSEDIMQHRMHREWYDLPVDTAAAINACRIRGRRVVAVGTTSVRVLETVAKSGGIGPEAGETDLFIYPPYEFRAVDALITNFHLPRSTLLLLVSAFGGPELIRQAYQEAVRTEYRFFSYGDAMLIV